jgi:ubiquinone/menaquinone biosynthesis C-methylase UbiE
MMEQVQKIQKQEQDRNPIWSRVEAKVLDAQVLDGIEDASISHVTGTMVYNLVANGRQALEAAHRVLLPTGVLGITLGAGAEWIDLVSAYYFLLLSALLRHFYSFLCLLFRSPRS